MKRSIFVLATLITSITLYAQKGVKLSFSDVNKRIVFPAIIKELTKEDKYQVVYPPRLSYSSGPQAQAQIVSTSSLPVMPVKAKHNLAVADYIFEVRMTGMTNVKVASNRWHRDEVGGPRGFVKDITYNFPVELIVRDAKGKLLQQVEVIPRDKEFGALYQTGYAASAFTPSAKQEEIDGAFNYGHDAFYRWIEGKIAAETYWKLKEVVGHLYGQFDSEKIAYIWGGVKEKGRAADYSDIDSANAKQKAGIDLYFTGKQEEAKIQLSEAAIIYENLLKNNEPRIDQNVQAVLHYNLAWIYMFNKDFTKAWGAYKSSLAGGASEQNWQSQQLRSRIEMFELREKLEKMKL